MADAKLNLPPLLQAWIEQTNESKKSFWLWNIGLFVAFVSTQAALLLFLVLSGIHDFSPISLRALLMSLVFFALADGTFVLGIMRNESLLNAERRVEKYEKLLEEQLDEYERMHAEMRQIARLRHDARNHLQVIARLEEKGEHEAARQMAGSISTRYFQEAPHD